MQYLDAVSKMTEWSLFVSKANHLISQLSKSMPQQVMLKEAEVEWFYEDLQDLLELTPKTWEDQTIWPVPWETCMQVRKQQLELDREQQTGSK